MHPSFITRRSALLGLGAAFTTRPRLAGAGRGADRCALRRGHHARARWTGWRPWCRTATRPWQRCAGRWSRPGQARQTGMADLGGFYGLHPAMPAMAAMYRAGELLPVHAVAGHYRSRSHFEAQDCMESGADHRMTSGWLNRAVRAMPKPPGPEAPGGRHDDAPADAGARHDRGLGAAQLRRAGCRPVRPHRRPEPGRCRHRPGHHRRAAGPRLLRGDARRPGPTSSPTRTPSPRWPRWRPSCWPRRPGRAWRRWSWAAGTPMPSRCGGCTARSASWTRAVGAEGRAGRCLGADGRAGDHRVRPHRPHERDARHGPRHGHGRLRRRRPGRRRPGPGELARPVIGQPVREPGPAADRRPPLGRQGAALEPPRPARRRRWPRSSRTARTPHRPSGCCAPDAYWAAESISAQLVRPDSRQSSTVAL